MSFKYLHKVNEIGLVLDHRLTSETRALFAAMSSRLPAGGIEARYAEVVEAVAADLHNNSLLATNVEGYRSSAEELLTQYPLHSKVQEFFDDKVKKYGHSSPLELTGGPSVYVQGVSPFTAYLSFDNPLVAGQEFSTRAVRRKDWPMCREAHEIAEVLSGGPDGPRPTGQKTLAPHPELLGLHVGWLEVFEAEVAAWQKELRLPCETCEGRGETLEFGEGIVSEGQGAWCPDCLSTDGLPTGKKYPWIKDPQAFRPALDRARWAIPSTIATGFCHTANTRVMGRVIQTGMDFARVVHYDQAERVGEEVSGTPGKPGHTVNAHYEVPTTESKVWQDIKEAYEEALPGMKGMWMREAVVGEERQLPGHLKIGFVAPDQEVRLWVNKSAPLSYTQTKAYIRKPNGYLDPAWNQLVQVHITFQCSWAVARDWHRHRTAYPWHLNIVSKSGEIFRMHNGYKTLTQGATDGPLLVESSRLFRQFREAGDMEKAMLCIPFGTLVSMHTTMGLRDAVYMLELRANAHGANFEYEAQAKEALKKLKLKLGDLAEIIFPDDPHSVLGLDMEPG